MENMFAVLTKQMEERPVEDMTKRGVFLAARERDL